MAKDFLSDAEMDQLGGKVSDPAPKASNSPDFIADADMDNLERGGHAQAYSPPSSQHAPDQPSDPQGAFLTGLDHYGDALTGGYAAHLQAAAAPAVDHTLFWAWKHGLVPGLDPKFAPDSYDDFKDNKSYVERRDENIKRIKDEAARHPTAAMVGTGAGLLNQALALGGLGEAAAAAEGAEGASAANTASKAAGLGSRLTSAARTGAIMGAVQNPGDTEGEVSPLQLDQRADNAITGAGTGLLTQGAIEGLGAAKPLAGKASDFLKDKAEKAAFKALGPYYREAAQAMDRGQINNIGREVLDSELIGKLKGWGTIANDAEALANEAGGELGSHVDAIDAAAQKASQGVYSPQNWPKAGLDRGAIASDLRNELLGGDPVIGTEGRRAAHAQLIDQFENGGAPTIGLREAQDAKTALKKEINWKNSPADASDTERFQRALYNKLGTGLEAATESMAGDAGPEALDRYRALKQRYGAMKSAADIAQKRGLKDTVNRTISPTDYGSAGIGAMLGLASGGSDDDFSDKLKRAAMGASLGLVNKGARTFGPQITARVADGLSKGLANPMLNEFGSNVMRAIEGSPRSLTVLNQGANRQTPFTTQDDLENERNRQIINNPDFLRVIQQRPDLIDKIQSPKLKAQLRQMMPGRNPSSGSAAPQQNQLVPLEDAQRSFIEKNK